MATVDEVRATFDAARLEISELDQALAAERKEIRHAAFHAQRPLTDEEIARRRAIAVTRSELADALETLALSTFDSVESADDLEDLLHAINSINQQLDDDISRLMEVANYAESAAKVAESIADVAAKLTEFRPTLLG